MSNKLLLAEKAPLDRRKRGEVELTTRMARRVERDSALPLSYAQEDLWFLCNLRANSAEFHISQVLPIGGPLNVNALEQAINEMIRRHEVLRTTFKVSNIGPVQMVQAHHWRQLPVVDLEELKGESQAAELRRLTTEDRHRPFNLEHGPVLRTTLVRLQANRHRVLHTIHHLVSDDFSHQIWLQETQLLYDAFSKGQKSPLADLPIQFADYAVWQRRSIQGEVLEKHLEYWRKQMAGMSLLCLPTDYPWPERLRPGQAVQAIQIHSALVEELNKLNGQRGVTMFMTVLAGTMVVINRCSGEGDISLSVYAGSRQHAGTEGVMGLFVQIMLLRMDLSGDPTVIELLAKAKKIAVGAYEHADIPWFMPLVSDSETAAQILLKWLSGKKGMKFWLLRRITRRLLKGILSESPKNMTIGSFLAGGGRAQITFMVVLVMFLVKWQTALVREILDIPQIRDFVDSVVELTTSYGVLDLRHRKLLEKILEKVHPWRRTMSRNRAHVILNYTSRPDEIESTTNALPPTRLLSLHRNFLGT